MNQQIQYRNIHAQAASGEASKEILGCNVTLPPSAQDASLNAQALPRLRQVTNSPAKEFASRSGNVEMLPSALISCILFRKAFETVGRDGIAFTYEGARRKYWAENSLVCTTMIGKKVLITFNRHNLDVIHILTAEGDYIETLPRKGEVDWFDQEATERELAARKRHMDRVITRLAHLHEPDTKAALARARANTNIINTHLQVGESRTDKDQTASAVSQTKRVVQNFELPENEPGGFNLNNRGSTDPRTAPQPSPTPEGSHNRVNQFSIPAPDASSFETSPSSINDRRKDDPAMLNVGIAAEDRARNPLSLGSSASPARTVTLAPSAQDIITAEESFNRQKSFHMEQKQTREKRAQRISAAQEEAFLAPDQPEEDSQCDSHSHMAEINEALDKFL